MKKEIVINVTASETRIAILEDDRLVELFVERPEKERILGDIYKGKATRVLGGIKAAFVDIGLEQEAFLPFSEMGRFGRELSFLADAEVTGAEGRAEVGSPPIRRGQDMVVQIIKEPLGGKGPRLTAQISIPGRFLVLMPNAKHVGVSRKIGDYAEKTRLKRLIQKIRPDGFGLIARTVSESQQKDVLFKDLEALLKTWNKIKRKIGRTETPALIHKDMGMASSIIRDLFTTDVDRTVVDDKKLLREIKSYLKSVGSHLLEKIEYYKNALPLFDAFKIERDIEKSLERKVWLRGGGYLVIEQTEALVTIDVNSGKYSGKEGYETNALRVNLKAAREVCRQIRLRDLGGIIVVDFIDMMAEKNRKKVYNEVVKELKKDRSQHEILPINKFGLLEITRERVRPSLIHTFNEPCPTCQGSGMVVSKETVTTKIERWIQSFRSKSKGRSVEIHVHPELAEYLKEGIRSRAMGWMWKYRMRIRIVTDESLKMEEFQTLSKSPEKEQT